MEFFLLFLLSTNKNRQPIGCLFLLVESIFFIIFASIRKPNQ
jgi:hypothetical protein